MNISTPKLYFKLSNTTIPSAPRIIEGALCRFEKEIRSVFRTRDKRYGTNITKLQENVLKYFKQYHEYIILLTNKNLSPYVMNRSEYIDQFLKQHL